MVQPISPRVVVVGDALIDEVADDTPAGSTDYVGGAGLNVAVGLSRLGVPTALLATVGDDASGAKIRELLESEGVLLVATTNPLGTGRAISERIDGEPRYRFTDATLARGLDFSSAQRDVIETAPLVAVSSYPFEQPDLVDALLEAVGSEPRRLVIDPNPRPGFLGDDPGAPAAFRAGFERAAASALLVKIGDDDARLVTGGDVEEWQEVLAAHGTGGVLATLGAQGASLTFSGGSRIRRPISQAAGDVVDTMGAGDATFASIVASLLSETEDWEAALTRAMDIAAATVRAPGALLRTPPAPPASS